MRRHKSKMVRGLSTALSALMVTSTLSLPGIIQPQEAYAAEEVTVTEDVYPGGVSEGLISWVNIEDSMNLAANNISITSLTDLVDLDPDVENDNVWTITNPNTLVKGAINFNSGILINSTKGYYIRTPFQTTDTAREVFSIQGPYEGTMSNFPWHFGGQGSGDTFTSGSIVTSFGNAVSDVLSVNNASGQYELGTADIFNVRRTQNSFGMYLNEKMLSEKTPTSNAPSFNKASASGGYYFGAGHNRRFTGLMTETILYDRELQTYERDKVNSYLALKYGITLTHDYVASDWNGTDGTVFWSSTNHADYSNRITGIGRDDFGAQNQKQSKSQAKGANVTIAIGNTIYSDNTDNIAEMVDNSYFVFGDNGMDDTADYADTSIIKDGIYVKVMDRAYQVEKTNWNDQYITLQIDDAEGIKASHIIISNDETFDANDSFYPVIGGKVTLDSASLEDGSFFTFAAAYPELDNAQLQLAEATDGHTLNLTFDRDVTLEDLTGFTIMIGDATYGDLTGIAYTVDGSTISITLTESQLASGGQISVGYDGSGSLKDGETGIPVELFNDVVITNKFILDKTVNEALLITDQDYTEASWLALQTKIGEAEALINSTEATQAQVDAAIDALQAAIDGLEKNPPIAEAGGFIEGSNTIAIDFDKAVKFNLGAGEAATDGFTVTVNGIAVTVQDVAVDSNDPTKVIITLPEGTALSGDDEVHANYDGGIGHLIGAEEEGTAVGDFSLNAEDPFAAALRITEPSEDTVYIRNPEIKGEVEAGSEVTVVIKDAGGQAVLGAGGIATVDENGNWSFTPSVDLTDGSYTVEVTGVKGSLTAAETKSLTVAASAPTLTIEEPSGTVVTESKPEFSGTASPGSSITVAIKDKDGNIVDTPTVTVLEDGTWSFTPDNELADGDYTFEITAVKNGKSVTEYKSVTIAASNAAVLDDLQLYDAEHGPITLTPAFTGGTYDYTVTTVTYAVYTTPILNNIAGQDPNAKIEISLNGGSWMETDNGTVSEGLPLNEGANTIVVKVTANGRETLYKITVNRISSGGDNDNDDDDDNKGSGGGGSTTSPTTSSELDVTLNGNDNVFATGTASTSGGRTITAVKVDQDKLADAISEGTGQSLAIHSPKEGDMTVEGLTADALQQLSDKGANLEIGNLLAIYPVPAANMDLSSVAGQLGNAELSDIAVSIDIKRSSEDLIASAKSLAAAEGYELLVDPVDLDLTFSHEGETVRIGQLSGYAPKYIAIPEGVDPNRITTGVIVNPDGTVFHVPTVVTKIDNRYFALINDLRSSGSYSVIWNPKDFDDVQYHWGKEDVNNIAARLSLKGNGDNTFSPKRHVTRSEFAEIIVLGLGLMRQDAPQNIFPDVPASAWYRNAVALADEIGIVRGYDDGNFKGSQQITREQGFAMIARAYRLIQSEDVPNQEQIASTLAPYADGTNVAGWAQGDVAQLVNAGIIQGNGPKLLSPKAEMTRAEVTALIARMLKVTNLIDK
ncbi:S-layer homology domain-containing protein [Paenibacillus sp. NPDC093718]|uniref:S-layer homology domain-containing protein n=1 Tax=Paenibacillus sp. NPDC093718 TaxID=3390601 RepID=UPI003D03D1A2